MISLTNLEAFVAWTLATILHLFQFYFFVFRHKERFFILMTTPIFIITNTSLFALFVNSRSGSLLAALESVLLLHTISIEYGFLVRLWPMVIPTRSTWYIPLTGYAIDVLLIVAGLVVKLKYDLELWALATILYHGLYLGLRICVHDRSQSSASLTLFYYIILAFEIVTFLVSILLLVAETVLCIPVFPYMYILTLLVSAKNLFKAHRGYERRGGEDLVEPRDIKRPAKKEKQKDVTVTRSAGEDLVESTDLERPTSKERQKDVTVTCSAGEDGV